MIEVSHLTKVFGRVTAVDDVSFHANPGEAIGLLGPNGSGKTTIMRTLAGYFPPTSGRVSVAGIDVTAEPLRARAAVGYLPETASWYPELRVSEFLSLCADVRRLRGARRRARLSAVLESCGLSDVAHRLIGMLSKGYKQRVGMAQALLHEPAVLILDEPTVGLDPRQVVEIRAVVRALRGRTTVLFSTHILSEVATVCDRVVIIDRGRLVGEERADPLARAEQGAGRLLIRIAAPDAAAVLQAVRGLPEVAAVEPQPGDDAAVRLLVTPRGNAAAVNAVAAAVLQHGWRLDEARPLVPSLEEVFVRLTAGSRR
jgi:ABC-2 type transport system ATP-binding protein